MCRHRKRRGGRLIGFSSFSGDFNQRIAVSSRGAGLQLQDINCNYGANENIEEGWKMSQKCNSPSVQLYATNVVTVNATSSSCFPGISNFLRKPREGHDHYHQFPCRRSVVRWVFLLVLLMQILFPLNWTVLRHE